MSESPALCDLMKEGSQTNPEQKRAHHSDSYLTSQIINKILKVSLSWKTGFGAPRRGQLETVHFREMGREHESSIVPAVKEAVDIIYPRLEKGRRFLEVSTCAVCDLLLNMLC